MYTGVPPPEGFMPASGARDRICEDEVTNTDTRRLSSLFSGFSPLGRRGPCHCLCQGLWVTPCSAGSSAVRQQLSSRRQQRQGRGF